MIISSVKLKQKWPCLSQSIDLEYTPKTLITLREQSWFKGKSRSRMAPSDVVSRMRSARILEYHP